MNRIINTLFAVCTFLLVILIVSSLFSTFRIIGKEQTSGQITSISKGYCRSFRGSQCPPGHVSAKYDVNGMTYNDENRGINIPFITPVQGSEISVYYAADAPENAYIGSVFFIWQNVLILGGSSGVFYILKKRTATA